MIPNVKKVMFFSFGASITVKWNFPEVSLDHSKGGVSLKIVQKMKLSYITEMVLTNHIVELFDH